MNKYTLLPYDFMQSKTLLYSKVVFYEFYFCYLSFKNSCQGILDNCKSKSDKAICVLLYARLFSFYF